MNSLNSGMRLAAVAATFLMLAACSSKSDSGGVAGDGSSSSIVPGSQADLVANVGDRVFFDTDQSSLSDEAKATLQRQAEWAKKYPANALTVEGHADERGTREYNLALGSRRANSAKDYLVSLGVDAARLSVISYGKERPVCLESNENCWAQNRRAVTVVAGGAGS
jgi:peptidoglycan-associated lipoprotein